MIEELKTFIQVVKYKNFTKASKMVNLSQPTVSLHIKRLENYFGTILIDRSNKNKHVLITEQGELLYEKGQEIIRQLEEVKSELLDLENKIPQKIKVGASKTIGDYLLPCILSEFSNQNSGVHIEVLIENTATICKLVKEETVDIGLIEGIDSDDRLEKEFFYHDKMVLIASNKSSLNNKENLSIDDIKDQVWISREEGSGTQEYLKTFLEQNGISPQKMIIFNSNYAVKEAVKNDLGITIISEYVVKHSAHDKELTILPMDIKPDRKYTYILPEKKKINKLVQGFIDKVVNCEIKYTDM